LIIARILGFRGDDDDASTDRRLAFSEQVGHRNGSYARTLARTLRDSGCDVSVLYGQRLPARRGLPLRLPAQVFGNDPHAGKWQRLLGDVPFYLRAALGVSRRSRATEIPLDGVELSAFEPKLPQCDQVLNAHALFERAHRLSALPSASSMSTCPLPAGPPTGRGRLPSRRALRPTSTPSTTSSRWSSRTS
jgi:hypothetical protein